MEYSVVAVQAIENFQLRMVFEGSVQKIFDMKTYLNLPVFRPLQNPGFFSLAKAEHGTVTWPGDIDIAPETLYFESVAVS